jgi:hypothetical protein
MSRIASCPACHGEITIPRTPHPVDQMYCPLCHAQFALAPVLANSVEAPPAALPVEPPQVGVPAAVGPSLSRVEDVSQWQGAASRSVARPKQRGPSVLGQLIGIVGGGALGLAIGYVILLRIGGAQYDFLQIADNLPRWMAPPARDAPRDGQESASQEQNTSRRSLADLRNEPDQPAAPTAPAADGAPSEAASPSEQETAPAQPVVQLGVRNAVTFTSDELGIALAEANAALGCEHCNSTGVVKRTVVTGVREVNGKKVQQTTEKRMPCEVCGGKPSAKMTPEVYQKFSRLAEVITFVESASAWHRREGVQNLLLKAGSDPQRAEKMGRLAGFQLDSAAREQKGIALAGTVESVDKEGPLHITRLVLFGLPKLVTVVSTRPARPTIDVRDRVIILGTIVDNPKENLAGYAGELPQVVWGGLPVKLPAAPQ